MQRRVLAVRRPASVGSAPSSFAISSPLRGSWQCAVKRRSTVQRPTATGSAMSDTSVGVYDATSQLSRRSPHDGVGRGVERMCTLAPCGCNAVSTLNSCSVITRPATKMCSIQMAEDAMKLEWKFESCNCGETLVLECINFPI